MKMEVLPVQNQFQGQFGVMGSSKIQGKFQFNQITRKTQILLSIVSNENKTQINK